MCNYQPYIYSCGHGTSMCPAFHITYRCNLSSTIATTVLDPGAQPSIIIAPTLSTGFPCWTCHKSRMEDIGDCASIYAYNNILEAVRRDEIDSLSPGEVGYYALLTGKPRPDTNGLRPLRASSDPNSAEIAITPRGEADGTRNIRNRALEDIAKIELELKSPKVLDISEHNRSKRVSESITDCGGGLNMGTQVGTLCRWRSW